MLDVLLIEDDPGDELITREAFETNTVVSLLHVAHDGQEGLDFLYRRGDHQNAPRPNLILLDLNLPKYDGRQLLEQIKNDPDLCHIPVVILSTSSAQEDISRSYKLHANAYITKPVDLDRVHERGAPDRQVLRSVGAPAARVTALCRCHLSCFEFAQGRAQAHGARPVSGIDAEDVADSPAYPELQLGVGFGRIIGRRRQKPVGQRQLEDRPERLHVLPAKGSRRIGQVVLVAQRPTRTPISAYRLLGRSGKRWCSIW